MLKCLTQKPLTLWLPGDTSKVILKLEFSGKPMCLPMRTDKARGGENTVAWNHKSRGQSDVPSCISHWQFGVASRSTATRLYRFNNIPFIFRSNIRKSVELYISTVFSNFLCFSFNVLSFSFSFCSFCSVSWSCNKFVSTSKYFVQEIFFITFSLFLWIRSYCSFFNHNSYLLIVFYKTEGSYIYLNWQWLYKTSFVCVSQVSLGYAAEQTTPRS